jgi:farnesyl-diphosphate farnesyltransferase
LQKTNIIRDYLEDVNHSRFFWPRAIWKMYTDRIENFKHPGTSKQAKGIFVFFFFPLCACSSHCTDYATQAVYCLNHLITDAMDLVPAVLTYLSGVRDQHNFNFCAIPQVMAAATLAECYSNHAVFTSVVKIRRGLAAKVYERARLAAACATFCLTRRRRSRISARTCPRCTSTFTCS